MMHALHVFKDESAIRYCDVPNLGKLSARIRKICKRARRDSKSYIHNALPVTRKDQVTFKILIAGAFIECT